MTVPPVAKVHEPDHVLTPVVSESFSVVDVGWKESKLIVAPLEKVMLPVFVMVLEALNRTLLPILSVPLFVTAPENVREAFPVPSPLAVTFTVWLVAIVTPLVEVEDRVRDLPFEITHEPPVLIEIAPVFAFRVVFTLIAMLTPLEELPLNSIFR